MTVQFFLVFCQVQIPLFWIQALFSTVCIQFTEITISLIDFNVEELLSLATLFEK